ncbi:MAG: alpha/beta hydrolase [Salinibacterium sp.]|nr:alpha/beta hydrolase [Salinibacterium sp.]
MSNSGNTDRPPIDGEYRELVASGELVLMSTILPGDVATLRAESVSAPIEQTIGDRAIRHETATVVESGMMISILTPSNRPIRGCVLAVHGGGLVVGDRYSGIEFTFDWIEQLGLAVVTPEYRLAPEHPYPAALTDCEHAIAWTTKYLAATGHGSLPLVLSGVSAGGTLAAALALTLRDRGNTPISGLMLQAPMLDHRNESVSSRQFSGTGQWDRESNTTGWAAYLAGQSAHEITAYMSPALATDLTGMPPTFIDVGSAELFRDEDVAFASALWAAGVDAQLAVWPGGVHSFDRFAPNTALAKAACTVRNEWLGRLVGRMVS